LETFTQAELELARWLVGREGSDAAAARRLWDPLAPRLANIFTSSGSTALLRRALYLAGARYPELEGARDGQGLERVEDALAGLRPAEAKEAVTALWATIVHLLITFIGAGLTLRILSDLWPGATLPQASSGEEDEP
jgi:hypothetical protein